MIRALPVVTLLGLAACSAPALMPELAQAEDHERRGQTQEALDAYARAQERCTTTGNLRLRHQRCREAYLGRAELLDRTGKRKRAALAYQQVPDKLPAHHAASAEAIYRAGRIYLELGEDTEAYTLLWRVVTHYPNEEFAADGLKLVVRDGRKRNPQELHDELKKLVRALAESAVADNLLYHMANLAEHELSDPGLAIAYLDQISERYRQGGLYDDALWHGARLLRATGKPADAVVRLRRLQSIREVAFGTGSYLSVWHDDGQLELGVVLRDDLRKPRQAARAFRELHELYPDSILRDDALFGEALAWKQAGDSRKACSALDRLARKHPDSRYQLSDAGSMRKQLGCRTLPAKP